MERKPNKLIKIIKSKKFLTLVIVTIIIIAAVIAALFVADNNSLKQLQEQQNKFAAAKQGYTALFDLQLQQESFADEEQYYQVITKLLKTDSQDTAIELAEIKGNSQNISFILLANKKQLEDFRTGLDSYTQHLAQLTDLGREMDARESSLSNYYSVRNNTLSTADSGAKNKMFYNIYLSNNFIGNAGSSETRMKVIQVQVNGILSESQDFNTLLAFIKQNIEQELAILGQLKTLEMEYLQKKADIWNKYAKNQKVGNYWGQVCSGTCESKMKDLDNEYDPKWAAKTAELVSAITGNKQQFKEIINGWISKIK